MDGGTPDAPGAWPAGDPSVAALPAALRPWVGWWVRLFWALPLAVYWATACRGPGWVDAALIAHKVRVMQLSSWVNNHDLFHLLGRVWTLLAPIDDFATSLNLLCATLGAATVYLFFRAGLELTGNLGASTFGAVALLFSHSLWWHSTILEVYTLNTALSGGMLFLVFRWTRLRDLQLLYGATICLGLGITNHVLMGLYVFAFLALLLLPAERATLGRGRVLFAGVVIFGLSAHHWAVSFLVDLNARLLETAAGAEQETTSAVVEAFRHTLDRATGGQFKANMFPEGMGVRRHLLWRLNYLFTLAMNFPSAALPLGLLGGWAWWRRPSGRTAGVFFAAGLGAQVLWSANYLIWDMYAFGLPVWVMFGLLVMVGADELWRRPGGPRVLLLLAPTLLVPPPLYAAIARWGSSDSGFWSTYFSTTRNTEGLWDGPAYFANPNKRGYRGTLDVLEGYERVLPEGGHLLDSDGKGQFPFALYWQKTLGRRTDVEVHHVFGPFLTTEKAAEIAQELRTALDEGADLHVSSLRFPERVVLVELWLLLDPRTSRSAADLRKLDDRAFAESFPGYRLERVPLDAAGTIAIYHLARRRLPADAARPGEGTRLEGEELVVLRPPRTGELRPQRLEGWSGDRQLQWFGGTVGEGVELSLGPMEPGTKVHLRPSLGRRYAQVEWQLDDQAPVAFDGFAPALRRGPELPLGETAGPGSHVLRVRITGAGPGAEPGLAVGFDYVQVVPPAR